MSMLGKVLIGLCIVAALVFGYLAIVDYDKRLIWTRTLFLYDLASAGLPLDAAADPEVSRELGKKDEPLLKDVVFKGIGEPVETQMEEVKRLQEKVRREIDSQPNEAAKRSALQTYLLTLARSGGRRSAIRDPKAALEQLSNDLDQEFAQASNPNSDRRQDVASLVYDLNLALNTGARAQIVLGLPAYASAAHRRAEALRDMAQSARYAIDRDRTEFEGDHQKRVQEIMVQAGILKGLRHSLTLRAAERDKWQTEVNKRTLLAADLNTEIAEARKAAEAALGEQTRKEQELIVAERGVAVAQEKNLRLENDIRRLERGR